MCCSLEFTDAWEQCKLGEVVNFFSGLTYSPENIVDDGVLVIRSSNIKDGELVNSDNVYVNPNYANSTVVKTGDIIVVVRNGSRDLIGKHAQVKSIENQSVIGAFMTGIRYDVPEFINALLDTSQFKIEINKNIGATINQITMKEFKKMLFPFPPFPEQQKIGEF
ncbi:restriction endonuclease subunit S, partial [Gallibacterium melopsittaci]